jgi:hypothetical protein
METKIIEATNGPYNWGKFLVATLDKEWLVPSAIPNSESRLPLLQQIAWDDELIWVLDLQTREGAAFRPGGVAAADLKKHAIWVCPLFEPFLEWLYTQNLREISKLPAHIDLPDAEFQMRGYRRPGPEAP